MTPGERAWLAPGTQPPAHHWRMPEGGADDLATLLEIDRLNYLPDYSLRKAYATAFRKRALPTPQALEKAGEKWRPYRTVASWYLWRSVSPE